MRLVRSDEVQALAGDLPEEQARLVPRWLEGPHNADRLDVAVVSVSPGGGAGPHLHIGGQVIVALSGRGFVEVVDGDRVELAPGDMLICPPGELHAHGALGEDHFSHITVTTGGYQFPDAGG